LETHETSLSPESWLVAAGRPGRAGAPLNVPLDPGVRSRRPRVAGIPVQPALVIADVAAICAAPRKPGSLLAVDNTLATPLNQRPLELGAR
jgi:Cys/Met metabolism PLP-dependent enzyme